MYMRGGTGFEHLGVGLIYIYIYRCYLQPHACFVFLALAESLLGISHVAQPLTLKSSDRMPFA